MPPVASSRGVETKRGAVAPLFASGIVAECAGSIEQNPEDLGAAAEPPSRAASELPVSATGTAEINDVPADSVSAGRVLVVEDNRTNQMILVATLKRSGYRVDAAGNGHAAIAALRNMPFDVVMMDVQMPRMGGVEATRQIRLLGGESARVPIIGVTAHTLRGDRERLLESGMDDYLVKPVDIQQVVEGAAYWVSRRSDFVAKDEDARVA